jgi:beta-lactamase regulating signal transducer with metallopeptidase domain
MNPLASLLITLGCEVLLVVGVGLVAERLLTSVRDRRRLWCAVLSVVTLLTAVELTGLRVEARRWSFLGFHAAPRPTEPRWILTEVISPVHPVEGKPALFSMEGQAPTHDLTEPSRWPSFLAAMWLLGTLVIGFRTGYTRWRLQALLRQSQRVDLGVAGTIAGDLGLDPRRIQVREATGFTGPVAFGVLRPTVLLPRGFADRYGELELKVLLAHELAHLAARDPLWLVISDVLSGLLWWHPAVWWACRRLRAASEAAADDASSLIPGGRIALAEALVAYGHQLAAETSPAGFGVGGLKSELAGRVTRLLSAPVTAASRLMTRMTVAGTVCALLAIGIAPWPGEGAQPVVTAALESVGSLASKPPRALKVTTESKSEPSRSDPRVPGFESGPSDSDRQPPSPRESPQSGESEPAMGENQDRSKADSTLPTALEDVVVPTFQIAEGPLQDVAQRLQQTLRDADPSKRDLRITVATQDLRIDQSILVGSGPAVHLLKFVADHCTTPVEWALHGNEIVFHKIASGKWPLHTKWYQVGSMELLSHIRGRLEKVGEKPSDKNIQNEVRAFLAEHGAVFPRYFDPASEAPDLAPPKEVNVEQDQRALFLSKDGGTLFVRTSIPDHKRIHRALMEHAARAMSTTQAPVLTNALDAASTKAKRTLHTRLFQVDTQKLLVEIRNRRAKAGHSSPGADVQDEVREFFVGQGVIALRFQTFSGRDEFNPQPDETAVFLKQSLGILFVQASDPDLALIEQALLTLFQHTQSIKTEGASFVDPKLRAVSDSTVRPSVASGAAAAEPRRLEVQIRLAEVRESKVQSLGLDWIFGNSTNQGTMIDAARDKERDPLAAILLDHRYRVDQSQTVGEQVELTPEQSKALLRSLQSIEGVDLLTMPKILTQSGRKACVEIANNRSVVVGRARLGDRTNKASMHYETKTVRTGPSVEFLPILYGDSVRLQVTATVTEFLGYDDPKDRGGEAVEASPHLRNRRATADATCSMGGTVVLRGPLVTETVRTKDQVPLLGDVPLLGRFFRSESSRTNQNRLYVFLTPVEVDGAHRRN